MVRFYNKRGAAEQWIKESQQATHLDAAVVPSLPGERSAAATRRSGLQPGQPLATAGAAAQVMVSICALAKEAGVSENTVKAARRGERAASKVHG